MNQEDIMLFNQYNAQLNSIREQKNQIKMFLNDMENALKETKASTTKDIYKNLGVIMIKTTKAKIEKDLENEIEVLNVRVKTIEKQEELITKQLNTVKAKLEANLPKKASKPKDSKSKK